MYTVVIELVLIAHYRMSIRDFIGLAPLWFYELLSLHLNFISPSRPSPIKLLKLRSRVSFESTTRWVELPASEMIRFLSDTLTYAHKDSYDSHNDNDKSLVHPTESKRTKKRKVKTTECRQQRVHAGGGSCRFIRYRTYDIARYGDGEVRRKRRRLGRPADFHLRFRMAESRPLKDKSSQMQPNAQAVQSQMSDETRRFQTITNYSKLKGQLRGKFRVRTYIKSQKLRNPIRYSIAQGECIETCNH